MLYRFRRLFFTVLILLIFLPLNLSLAQVQEVSVPDTNLAAAIRAQIGNSITTETMLNLTRLNVRLRSIADLTGLEHAQNLTYLWLEGNSISDVSALSGLTNLIELFLDGNSISNISALSKLTNLKHLWLEDNSISDVSALSGLTQLTHLYLGENSISNISALSGLTQLTHLSLYENSISDISALSGLTNLIELELDGNSISDISPLLRSTAPIESVYLYLNPLSSASINTHIPALEAKGIEVFFTETNEVPSDEVSSEADALPAVSSEKRSRIAGAVSLRKLRPSPVAQDRVIFNELRNAFDDTHDWIELKNISEEDVSLTDWEISLVTPTEVRMYSKPEDAGQDVDLVAFPDYTLPAGGILVITNTPPSETYLTHGQDITDPESDPDGLPQYLVAPEMILPNTPYLLILRSAGDKNGKPEAFEDVLGTYFRNTLAYQTQVWPLQETLKPLDALIAPLTVEKAYQRIDRKKRGYLAAAWEASGHQSGLGYKPKAPLETSLGSPGYPNDPVMDENLAGRVTFSELMFTTNGGLFSLPQWIELYNNTPFAALPINLKGWKLVVETREPDGRHRHSVIELEALEIAPTSTVLLVTRSRRHSEELSADQIYHLSRHHSGTPRLGLRENAVLSTEGFALKLITPNGILVDGVGTLDGERGRDDPMWELPSGWTEDGARTSLIRRYIDDVGLSGTESRSWVRAADLALSVNTYYGAASDLGTPGYREGGAAPVQLSHFRASRTDGGVMLEWETQSELSNAGFHVLRSETKTGGFVKVNPSLIPGAGTSAERHTYIWIDTPPSPNVVYYYRIADVSLSGIQRELGTVRLRGHISAGGKLLRPWGDLKTQD